MLRVARCGAVKARTQAGNQLRDLIVTAPEKVRQQLAGGCGTRRYCDGGWWPHDGEVKGLQPRQDAHHALPLPGNHDPFAVAQHDPAIRKGTRGPWNPRPPGPPAGSLSHPDPKIKIHYAARRPPQASNRSA